VLAVADAVMVLFRFVAYTAFGLVMETLFSVDGIERCVGATIPRRVPRKYLEGFVSLYMIPLHGLGILFLLEPMIGLCAAWSWPWPVRFGVYAAGLTVAEVGWGFLLDKVLGFHPWDYYRLSPWRIGRRGYSLWTLVPLWGFAGLVLEQYVALMRHLAPLVAAYYGL
jgi:hypothetical protein